MLSNKELSKFLKEKNNVKGFLNHLKIVYRPYICPFKLLLEYIKPGSSVLDIGCGQGQFAMLLAEYTSPTKIKGIDIAKQSIREAVQLFSGLPYKNVSFNTYNGFDLPDDLPDFDYITMIDVFHHIPAKQQEIFIEKLHGNMCKGQTLIFKDIDAASPFVLANKLHDKLLTGETGCEKSKKQMSDILKNTGFNIISKGQKQMLWYPHFWYITNK